ncbi:glycoside hydrolase family 28 protein [Ensifer adhaerens]|uniref:polygalacturonase PglA n=1 Tax=Ensifer adhaerens TaxID=106592 RepID=UPI001CBF77CB|nr:glycoside hydrolase family 28 protein [Ensifer adhaerens]MBZ7926288.1 glycoside hydrolase family 28 protein [Ensifer adhaerens]UAX97352.1 glycoside hydrolase family 28 protein [Ensifer adhaerens]UAY03529.1 glycoside hydrolase family 28 protein [Ensifer adhaerens]UAY11513.1 glycoside hydrolase family 28 protein [Ensifer adhaerens]
MTRPSIIALSARTAALCLPARGARYHLPGKAKWRLSSLDGDDQTRQGETSLAVPLLHDLQPNGRYCFEAEGFETVAFETASCTGLVDASDFGLVRDIHLDDLEGARRNTAALREAVAAVPEGGKLRLPAGVWTAFPFALKSHMTFHLSRGAVLRAPSGRLGWPILPARDASGGMLGSWEGLPADCFAAPLHAVGVKDLVIEGEGTLDGSGDRGDWWSWPKETRDGARRPRGLHIVSCSDVTLLGFTIRNAPSWTIHPQGCRRLTAAGLFISAPADSPNTDGFNPESCQDVTIAGVRFSVGDDCIAVKAGKRGQNGEDDHLSETRGIRVSHCLMERGHGGLVIGSEMSGGVHDVAVENCAMVGTDRGLRIKTRRGRGGAITDITMRHVLMDGVETALSANAYYHCDADGHDAWVQSRRPAPVEAGTPVINGVTIEDVEIRDLAHAAGAFLGLPEAPIRNIKIRRLNIASFNPEAAVAPPIMADRIRPMRHETIVSERAEVDCDDPALLSAAAISTSFE